MLTVSAKREPVRVDLGEDAYILFKPLGTYGLVSGRQIGGQLVAAGEDASIGEVAFTIAAARWGAIEWGGIGDDEGQPLELTADSVQALLEQSPVAYAAVDAKYVIPAILKAQEKNGSGLSPLGTSQGSAPAKPARAKRGAGVTTAANVRKSAKPARTATKTR